MGGPCHCPAGGGAVGDCQAVALALWAQPVGGSGPRALSIRTHYFCLSLSPCLFVTESGGPAAEGSFGGGGPALPPSFCPSPWLLLWSSSTPSPLVPWKLALHSSCPCLLLPGNSHPFQSQGRGGRGEDGQVNRVWGSVHPPPRIHRTKPRIPLSSPVLFLLQPQSLQVSGLQGPRGEVSGQAEVPEQAGTWHVSEATETLPHCILPHGAVFRDSLRQRIKILPQSRN